MTDKALAIFVKTARLSEVKTRLAVDFGRDKAREFYEYAIRTTAKQVYPLRSAVDIYWAVAEEQADVNDWPDFPILYQGTGNLGDRLHQVYHQLISEYSNVGFIGADSPQIAADILNQGFTDIHDFTFGPTEDGGFYFFRGTKPLPVEIWKGVTYSESTTLSQLVSLLKSHGTIGMLPENFDVDTLSDLQRLAGLSDVPEPLRGWLSKTGPSHC